MFADFIPFTSAKEIAQCKTWESCQRLGFQLAKYKKNFSAIEVTLAKDIKG